MAGRIKVMRHFLSYLLFCCPALFGERLSPEAPITTPKQAAAVALPENIQKAAKDLGLKTKGIPVFHDSRNILELSYYGNRRGVPCSNKSAILIEKGLQRYWLANRFPHPDPTTILGPFQGNALEKLKVRKLMEDGLTNGNYSTYIQAISGLLKSEDYAFIKLGLQLVPSAMSQSPHDVHSFMHFLERSLPSQKEAFAKMNLTRETTLALQSMEEARERIKAVTVQPPTRNYQAGYDPAKEQRNGIGVLPEEAWGEAKNGLQAAITLPPTMRLNEKHRVYFVFRNISDKTLRVSFPEITGNLRLTHEATPHLSSGGTEGVGGHRQPLTHWSLAPGHQAMVICRDLQLMKEGTILPKRAWKNSKPGKITAWASSGSRDKWDYRRDQEPRLVAVPESNWKGYLKAGKRSFILLDDEVPYVPTAPNELGQDHGLQPVSGFPKGLDYHRSETIVLSTGVLLYLNNKADAHWIIDHDTHRTTLAWGPISTALLHELGLVDLVEKNTLALLEKPSPQWDAYRRLTALVQKNRPFAELALHLAPRVNVQGAHSPDPDSLTRTIRNHRVTLAKLGLKNEADSALKALSESDAPLPPKDQFTVIDNREFPPTLKETAWGPEVDGLRAAALMPTEIKDGTTADVRLFLHNVSDHDIFLTVSNRGGYDYAIATNAEGDKLKVEHPHVYPTFFSSVIRPEINPGQTSCHPPLATLTKLRIQSNAVYELKTQTVLTFQSKENASRTRPNGFEPVGTAEQPAENVITSAPTEALVTWRLHTANGAEHSKDLKSRTWPAKGGWTGILETALLKVSLSAAEKK